MQNLFFKTFGCKVNQYNTELLSEQLVQTGSFQLSQISQSNMVVLNSCVVTLKAEQEVMRFCRKYARMGKKVFATGCISEKLKVNLIQEGIAFYNSKELLQLLIQSSDEFKVYDSVISNFQGHTRAFVKVQSGCNQYCSYCIVPFVRGKVESRPRNDIKKEIKKLTENGYKEIVLTGTQIGLFQDPDQKNYFLIDLLKELEENFFQSLNRIRISSIGPTFISNEMIDFFAKSKLFCNHLHISLQSGSNHILQKMNRKYSAEYFLELNNRLRDSIRDLCISTDVIVGFPGESEEDFQQTQKMLEKVNFSKLHIFPYSSRAGTVASSFTDSIKPAIIKKRTLALLELSKVLSYNVKRSFVGKKVEVLVEEDSSGFSRNYLRVVLQETKKAEKGQLKDVIVALCDSDALYEKN